MKSVYLRMFLRINNPQNSTEMKESEKYIASIIDKFPINSLPKFTLHELSHIINLVCDEERQKAIEAFRIMGEETRFAIPTDVLGKAREIFERELNS